MMQEAFLLLPAPPPSNRHFRLQVLPQQVTSCSTAVNQAAPCFYLTLSCLENCPAGGSKLWCCGVVLDKTFELLRGVESLSCPSGLCVCRASCLQRRCDPVLACHLSCLLPSHLCICHSPSCPYGKIPLSHWALTYSLLPSATTAPH